jgi:hypothetical protein
VLVSVPVTEGPYGSRETTISGDQQLVVVTVFVRLQLQIHVISNKQLSVTFVRSFIMLDW